MTDHDYIKNNILKLSTEQIQRILVNYKELLDKTNARIEKKNIGTYLFLERISPDLALQIKRSIAYYLDNKEPNMG